jgi:hypothetical protein
MYGAFMVPILREQKNHRVRNTKERNNKESMVREA